MYCRIRGEWRRITALTNVDPLPAGDIWTHYRDEGGAEGSWEVVLQRLDDVVHRIKFVHAAIIAISPNAIMFSKGEVAERLDVDRKIDYT